jgi:phosphoribosylamine--glycine ligase
MIQFGVPTAKSVVVKTTEETMSVCSEFTPPYVLKADGLAAGKGVFICKTKDELREAAVKTFEQRIFGAAGDQALLEQFTPGFEISYLVLTNGRDFQALPLSQDHKRLFDGDEGPNTGGMGTVAPVAVDKALEEKFRNSVMKPILRGLTESKFVYRGVLFIGLMITKNSKGELEPSVLEFNTRFGDPETQVVLPLLAGDWGQVFKAVASGDLPKLNWKSSAAACVVLAAEGYPDSPRNGVSINGLSVDSSLGNDQYVLHAGTRSEDHGTFVTNGGRVLNVIGLGKDISDAIAKAYAQVEHISWPGMQFRKDIGKKI